MNRFEKEIKSVVDSKAALALASETAAVHMVIKLLGICRDDIVFYQSLTFLAMVNPVIYEGSTQLYVMIPDETSVKAAQVAIREVMGE